MDSTGSQVKEGRQQAPQPLLARSHSRTEIHLMYIIKNNVVLFIDTFL